MRLWTSLVLCLQLICQTLAQPNPSPSNVLDIIDIKQTINLFAILVDSHQYTQLDRVFTSDATANFNLQGGSILRGLDAIVAELSELANVTSQHEFTTQYVNLLTPETANATSYFIRLFFGSHDEAGQIFTEYGRYGTTSIRTADGWRVNAIDLVAVGQSGNISIVFPAR